MGVCDCVRYKNALQLFIHLRSSSKSVTLSIRDVKSSKAAQKLNRNTKQNVVNPPNSVHTAQNTATRKHYSAQSQIAFTVMK